MSKGLFDKILSEVALDSRINDGIFRLEEDEHMTVFREYLVNKGIDEANVVEFCNKVLEGKYPERQAFNANGILVTFPTPEYKAEAIKAGTHFEKDPTKGQSNLFKKPSTSTGTTPPPDAEKEKPSTKTASSGGTSEPKTNLPISQAQPAASADDQPQAQPVQAMTTAAPQQTATATTQPPEATEPPPPAPKSPAEIEMNKDVIKQMLRGDDYMLEQVVKWMMYNAPEYLQETVQKKTL